MFHAKFGWNWPSGSEEEFKLSSMYFCNLAIISPWKRTFEQTWIPFTKGWLRQVGWNWFSGSGEDYYILTTYFRFFYYYYTYYPPFRKGCGPSFDKTSIHFTEECFVPSLVEIGPVVLEKKIFEFRPCINTLPLKKEVALHLNKPESPHPRMFVPSLVEICLVVLELSAQIR